MALGDDCDVRNSAARPAFAAQLKAPLELPADLFGYPPGIGGARRDAIFHPRPHTVDIKDATLMCTLTQAYVVKVATAIWPCLPGGA
jgi:hypothetical protein